MFKDNLMEKTCGCGGDMTIHMHTLVFNTKIKITDVPVYTCEGCARYEPLPMIKRDLGKLVEQLGKKAPVRNKVSFAKRNEWAYVLKESFSASAAQSLPELEEDIRKAIQSRIDLLLDIYRFAGDSRDQAWMEETSLRLSQLTLQSAESAK